MPSQAEYAKEGIQWREVGWRDNQRTLELIEGRPDGVPGILYALDDATWHTKGDDGSADKNFITQLHRAFGGAAGGKADRGGHHPSYATYPNLHRSSP